MKHEQRDFLSMGRITQYGDIMRTTLFAFVAIAAIIELGSGAYSAPLTVLIIATTAYGVLAGGTALDDVINLVDDMDEETAATNFGKALKKRNIPALKLTSSILLGLIGIAELFALWT